MKKKVIVRLSGGLGNQMFSYAAGRRLSIVNDASLVLDTLSGFVRDIKYKRTYQLDKFVKQFQVVADVEKNETFLRIKRCIKRDIFNRLRHFENRNYIKEYGIGFDERLLDLRFSKNLHLEGVWQSENYFKDIKDIIRQDFEFVKPTDDLNIQLASQMQEMQSVMVHVRFHDEDHLPKIYQVTPKYYNLAFDLINKTIPNAHFFVFSDNPEQVQKWLNLSVNNVTYVNHNVGDNSHFDMWLMTYCKYFIIANSTFSWWGAWLAEHHDKFVIAPNICLHNWAPSWRSILGVLPTEWIKI